MQKRSRIIFLSLVLLLTACGPSAITQDNSPNSLESQQVKSDDYLQVKHQIPEPTVEPTPLVVSFPVTVTFYTANDPNQGTTDRTASGKPVSRGMVAVNARMLTKYPFGTKVYIHGIGEATVEDIGGGPDDWMDYYWDGTVDEALRMGRFPTTATIERER